MLVACLVDKVRGRRDRCLPLASTDPGPHLGQAEYFDLVFLDVVDGRTAVVVNVMFH